MGSPLLDARNTRACRKMAGYLFRRWAVELEYAGFFGHCAARRA